MLELKRILVPIDFSARSVAAAEHAGALAQRFDSELIFVHVVPVSPYEYAAFESGLYTGSKWPTEEELAEKLGRELAVISTKFAPHSRVEKIILKGDAPAKIERVAKEKNVDLIVMPTHGYGTFRRFVLGSVTTKVLHDLECPILTGAHVEEVAFGSGAPYRRIACAVDLREHSEAVLKWASGFAQAFGADLTVVHAAPILDAEPETPGFGQELMQMLIRTKEEEVRELLARVGSSGSVFVDCDSVTNLVPHACQEIGADLVVIGRSPLRGLLGRLRTHAHALVRVSPCPVVSV